MVNLLHTERISQQIENNIMKQAATMPQQLFGGEVPSAQKEKFDTFQQKLKQTTEEQIGWKILEPAYIDLYAKTYTETELDAILTFYKSPAGQSMLNKSPELSTQSVQMVQAKMSVLQPQLQKLAEDFVQSTRPTSAQPPPTLNPTPKAAPQAAPKSTTP
ncbi:MAG: DUF2059 domain-containing protein [Acidobacteria bacterium]|nr:DUF2059 domain-containing protein [Acidobacteriota bacterium]